MDELNETDLSRVGDSLAPQSASNVLKHLHAQKLFLNTSSDIALVLEDDVVLFESFFDELNHILRMTNHLPPMVNFSWVLDNKWILGSSIPDGQYLVEKPLTTAEA